MFCWKAFAGSELTPFLCAIFHRSDKQISDWLDNRSPVTLVEMSCQVRVWGDSTAPSYRTASALPAAPLQLNRRRSVAEDIWTAITPVALCQFAGVGIIWLVESALAKKGRLTSRIRSHFRFSNVSFTRRIIGKEKSRWVVEGLSQSRRNVSFKLCPQKSRVWYLARFVVFVLAKSFKSSNISTQPFTSFVLKPPLSLRWYFFHQRFCFSTTVDDSRVNVSTLLSLKSVFLPT